MEPHPSSTPPSDNEAGFDNLLRSARVNVPLPGAFQAEVWRRISQAQEDSLGARWARNWEALLSLLVRPAVAGTAVALMVAAGLFFGSSGQSPSQDGKLAYVESVSPFVQAHTGGSR